MSALPHRGKGATFLEKDLTATESGTFLEKDLTTTVSYRYFEPSQPQKITSGLKQTSICLLFTLHTSHQTTNSLKPTKSVLTQICI